MISYYLKKIQFQKRLTSVSEICEALNDLQNNVQKRKIRNMTENIMIKNKIDINDKYSNIFEITDNFLKTKNSKLEDYTVLDSYYAFANPILDQIESQYLEIKQIESLYNIQNIKINGEFQIFTTIFSDLNNLLSINASLRSLITNRKKNQNTNMQVVRLEPYSCNISHLKNKHHNIIQDIAHAERLNLKFDDINADQIEISDEKDINLTQNSVFPEAERLPHHCLNRIKENKHAMHCDRHCYFTIEEIAELIPGRLKEELKNHNHPQSLIKEKTYEKTIFYNTNELKQILKEHYEAFHFHDFN